MNLDNVNILKILSVLGEVLAATAGMPTSLSKSDLTDALSDKIVDLLKKIN
jgi:hypothetical protein